MTKGYDNTSVQNIIDKVGIAKGTFYHYFKSKEELVEEITTVLAKTEADRMYKILAESDDDALTKFNLFFDMQSKWKETKIDILYAALKVLYSDENILFLKKSKEKNFIHFQPIMSLIITQGVKEGIFHTPFPESIGEMIIRISNDVSDELAHVFLNYKSYDDPLAYLEEKIRLFIHCIERLLGLESGLINMVDMKVIESFIKTLERNDIND